MTAIPADALERILEALRTFMDEHELVELEPLPIAAVEEEAQ